MSGKRYVSPVQFNCRELEFIYRFIRDAYATRSPTAIGRKRAMQVLAKIEAAASPASSDDAHRP